MALKRSPEFFKLIYKYLLKVGYIPGDSFGGHLWSQSHIFFYKLGRSPVDDVTYKISMLLGLAVSDKNVFMFSPK